MKITIEGTAKEIAKLVLELQARQEDKPVNIKLVEVGEEELVRVRGEEIVERIRLT